MLNSFDYIVDVCLTDTDDSNKFLNNISEKDYRINFHNQWLFDAIAGKRFGQSFCDYYGIGKYVPLYYMSDNGVAQKWAEKFYIKHE